MISKKIILTGSFGVGKTSLFNRFIYQQFSDKYMTTIGVKVNNKVVDVENEQVSLMVWDIAGEITQDKVPASYFLGASGIIYIMDLTRPQTFKNLDTDMQYLHNLMPNGDILIVANKSDLVTKEQKAAIAEKMTRTWDFLTSAKTGDNVEALFSEMGKRLLQHV